MRLLWDQRGMEFPLRLPPDIGPMIEVGAAFAGTAAGFRDYIAQQVQHIGANYLSCDVAFGDMTFAEAMRTTELIGREVIPAFAARRMLRCPSDGCRWQTHPVPVLVTPSTRWTS